MRAIRDNETELLYKTLLVLLSKRVRISMVNEAADYLENTSETTVKLCIIDEAHHASEASYQRIMDRLSCPKVFLTATWNRTDQKSLGIDYVAYSTTPRNLMNDGVIIEPEILPPLTIEKANWENPDHRMELAQYVLDRSLTDFQKTLIVMSRVEHVEAMYNSFQECLLDRDEHDLNEEDITFLHGSGSSKKANWTMS